METNQNAMWQSETQFVDPNEATRNIRLACVETILRLAGINHHTLKEVTTESLIEESAKLEQFILNGAKKDEGNRCADNL